MPSEREQLRKLRQKLITLEVEAWDKEREGQPPFVQSVLQEAIQNHVKLLRQQESRMLIRRAESWGIEIPRKPEWYTVDHVSGFGLTDVVTDMQKRRRVEYLSEKGFTMITKEIREARFAYWKRWAEILIPILSLIVAILALLKD